MSNPKAWVDEHGTPVPCLKTGPCPCDDPCQRLKNMLADPVWQQLPQPPCTTRNAAKQRSA
jgi:hypothetical protein